MSMRPVTTFCRGFSPHVNAEGGPEIQNFKILNVKKG